MWPEHARKKGLETIKNNWLERRERIAEETCPSGHSYGDPNNLGFKSAHGGTIRYCKECSRQGVKRYRKSHPDYWRPKSRNRINELRRKWRKEHREEWLKEHRDRHRGWFAKIRGEVMEAYGRKCVCCGETEDDFLTLDHINNDGAAHRKLVGGPMYIYKDVKKQGFPKDKFQILCMNCNWVKRHGKICPHQRNRVT